MVLFSGKFTNIYYGKYNRNMYLIMVNGEISIASYNCNGLADNKKRQISICLAKREGIEYLLFRKDKVAWENDWGGAKYISAMGKETLKG